MPGKIPILGQYQFLPNDTMIQVHKKGSPSCSAFRDGSHTEPSSNQYEHDKHQTLPLQDRWSLIFLSPILLSSPHITFHVLLPGFPLLSPQLPITDWLVLLQMALLLCIPIKAFFPFILHSVLVFLTALWGPILGPVSSLWVGLLWTNHGGST